MAEPDDCCSRRGVHTSCERRSPRCGEERCPLACKHPLLRDTASAVGLLGERARGLLLGLGWVGLSKCSSLLGHGVPCV